MAERPEPPRVPPTYEARGPGSEPTGLAPQKLVAASIASVLAAVVTSRFGVAGTVIGAGLTPVIVILSVFALESSMGRARAVATTRVVGRPTEADGAELPRRLWFGLTRLTRQRIAFAIAAGAMAAGLGLVAITAIESVAGRPLSGILRDGDRRGTTLSPGGRDAPQAPVVDQGEPRPRVKPGNEAPAAPQTTPQTQSTPVETTPAETAPTAPAPTTGSTQPDSVKP